MSKISIVIPVYNESVRIVNLIKYLLAHSSGFNVSDIIVVDGGSTDQTVNEVNYFIKSNQPANNDNFIPVKLLHSEKGRAKQMNTGSKASTANILYFLHADCFPPKYFDQYIIDTINKGSNTGCFRMKFDSNHWWLKLAGWFTQLNWRMCRGGDQSLFITKELFETLGGYDESYQIYEDNILIAKLYKHGKFKVIQQWISSSARNYQKHGVWKLQYHYWMVHLKKRLGASPQSLYQYYKKHFSC
ncbi:TIGR04283 family arsenosugar biosynthesis glycosyltransferase [Paucihalobacter sp.]|uniref:TIGR04283 family arsenosugar biosynthesis glycosyltransferase n=1 Tax=Paucihalobacter sp. TaxID=2850405 RepID=UPI002FE3DCCB